MRKSLVAILVILLISTIVGCAGPTPTSSPTTTPAATTKPPVTTSPTPTVKTPSGTLTIALTSLDTEKFHPWDSRPVAISVYGPMYDHLLQVDPVSNELIPGLATEWKMAEDGLTWTFKLRQGVQFHDNWGEFTSADVKFSIEKNIAQDSISGKAGAWRENISSIETPDNYTVIVHMKKPDLGFNSDLSPRTNVVMTSKKYIETVGDQKANEHPIGTGPYKFSEHRLGESIKYEAVPNHWRIGTPEWQYIVVKAMPEEATRVNALLAGEVDIIPISLESVPRIESAKLRLFGIPEAYVSFLCFGGLIPSDNEYFDPENPFLKKEVREALNLAINREEIVKTIYRGQAEVATVGYAAQGWRDLKPYPYDPARAKQLLADAGYPNGFTTEIKYHGAKSDLKPVSEAVAMFWEAIGVKVKLTPGEYDVLRGVVRVWNTAGWVYPFALGTGYYDNFERVMTGMLDPERAGGFVTVLQPSVYDVVRQLYGELDVNKRKAIAKNVQSALYDGYWHIPIAVPTDTWAIGNRVGTWSPITTAYVSKWETATHAP